MATMVKTGLARLVELAVKATPDPGNQGEIEPHRAFDRFGYIVATGLSTPSQADGRSLSQRAHDQIAFIAAANPQAIQQIAEYIGRLERERDFASQQWRDWSAKADELTESLEAQDLSASFTIDRLTGERDAAQKLVESLSTQVGALTVERDRLREALKVYAEHAPGCDYTAGCICQAYKASKALAATTSRGPDERLFPNRPTAATMPSEKRGPPR